MANNTGFGEKAKVSVDEEIIVHKFWGDEQTLENLAERVCLKNGELIWHEHYENGKLVARREIGGNDGAN